MATTKAKKAEVLKTLKDRFGKMKAAVFAANEGMSVKSVSTLRRKLRESKIDFQVAKKTLINLAAQDAKIANFDVKQLTGAVGVAFGYEDEITPAKLVQQFTHIDTKLVIVGGVMEGRMLSKEEVEALATLPSKPELLGKLLGTMMGPVSGFVRVCNGPVAGFVRVLSGYSKKLA